MINLKINNDSYTVEITHEIYSLESTDNKHYDKVFNPFKFSRKDYYSSTQIIIDNSIDEHRCMLISEQNYANTNGIIKGDTMLILAGKHIFKIALDKVCIEQIIPVEAWFSVYYDMEEYSGGYVVIGELSIVQYDFDFNKIDEFETRDVVTSWDLQGDTLWVKDFNDEEYTFNLSLCSHDGQNNVI